MWIFWQFNYLGIIWLYWYFVFNKYFIINCYEVLHVLFGCCMCCRLCCIYYGQVEKLVLWTVYFNTYGEISTHGVKLDLTLKGIRLASAGHSESHIYNDIVSSVRRPVTGTAYSLHGYHVTSSTVCCFFRWPENQWLIVPVKWDMCPFPLMLTWD